MTCETETTIAKRMDDLAMMVVVGDGEGDGDARVDEEVGRAHR